MGEEGAPSHRDPIGIPYGEEGNPSFIYREGGM